MTQSVNFLIETPDLGKSIGGDLLLRGVDLSMSRQSVFGFLNPNRGGKSALKKALLSSTTDRGLILYLLLAIGSVGLIVSQSLFCQSFILMALFSFKKTGF